MVFKVRARKYEFSIFEKSGNFTWYKINRILLGSTCFRKLESDILRGHDRKRESAAESKESASQFLEFESLVCLHGEMGTHDICTI